MKTFINTKVELSPDSELKNVEPVQEFYFSELKNLSRYSDQRVFEMIQELSLPDGSFEDNEADHIFWMDCLGALRERIEMVDRRKSADLLVDCEARLDLLEEVFLTEDRDNAIESVFQKPYSRLDKFSRQIVDSVFPSPEKRLRTFWEKLKNEPDKAKVECLRMRLSGVGAIDVDSELQEKYGETWVRSSKAETVEDQTRMKRVSRKVKSALKFVVAKKVLSQVEAKEMQDKIKNYHGFRPVVR